jgi:hypothetical protein
MKSLLTCDTLVYLAKRMGEGQIDKTFEPVLGGGGGRLPLGTLGLVLFLDTQKKKAVNAKARSLLN